MSDKRPADVLQDASTSTPAKRVKTDGPVATVGGNDSVASSPAVAKDTDSPSLRGKGGHQDRGGRGRGRGGGPGGRGRGGKREDSRSWGGRNSNARGGKMREWGAKEGEGGKTEGAAAEESGEKKERLPKKKVAVLFGYNGLGYHGSQINPKDKTIEGEIWKAFIAAGAISEDNASHYSKVGLSRAARTDAGVSAAVNVISLKLILTPPNKPADSSIEAWINTFLPPSIRIWSCIPVQGSFNPRALCDQRHYEYTVPTHVFLGPKPNSVMFKWLEKARATTKSTTTSATNSAAPVESSTETATPSAFEAAAAAALADSETFWAAQPEGSEFSDDIKAKRKWRISPGLLQSARDFVKGYEGSHNYYNFTVAKDFRDRSCQRVMRSLTISDPFIVNEVEYVSVAFVGQSFMMNQIRKMIGLLILSVRSSTPPSLIPETFGPSRIHIPKAPGLGLQLLEPQYLEYNRRMDESNKKLQDLMTAGRMTPEDVALQSRDPVKVDAAKVDLDKFKHEEVYKKMWEVEEESALYSNWLNYFDYYVGSDFEYLNPKGVIPASAVFKKDENPEKVRLQKGAALPENVTAPLSDDEAGPEEEDG